MLLEHLTINEFENNFSELKELYGKFTEKYANSEKKDLPPLIWKEEGKRKKESPLIQYERMFSLIEFRYEAAKKVWFDGSGNVKAKYRNLLINFFGTMSWFAFRLQSLYNGNSSSQK
ncbi:MAG: hypothetical protein N3A54_03885 [Patescibacteria group bacterium]|nr:hypothetical protein [Patescibacteria group bacterium]